MLLVEHGVAPSAVHGLGVFAKHAIAKGTLIWRVRPVLDREIRRADLADLPQHVVQNILIHAEYLPARQVFRLAADGAFFMIQSDHPNVLDAGDTMIAAWDIAAGQERLCDDRVVRVLAFDPVQPTCCRPTADQGA